MESREDELRAFKANINLTEFAAANGYRLDQKATSRNSAVMVSDDGDKIVVARGRDNHWVYFSVRNHRDNGTIIDFVSGRQGLNLGQVRRVLRPWLSGSVQSRPAPALFVETLEPTTRDLMAVRAAYEAMSPLHGGCHPYLNETRKLPSSLLSRGILEDRIRIDPRGNTAFVHFNRDGVCGFELKNQGFTGFSKHGTKGLWGTRPRETDTALAIAESAIDALSYCVLSGDENLRLLSTGGAVNDQQPELITAAIQKLPRGEVIIAADNDEGGDTFAAMVRRCFENSGRSDLGIGESRPQERGTDWNDYLIQSANGPAPSP